MVNLLLINKEAGMQFLSENGLVNSITPNDVNLSAWLQ
jgi:hypothetical protein